MIDEYKLEQLIDGLLKETQRGRYAEVGAADHFNDGVYALQEAMEEAGMVGGWDADDYRWAIAVGEHGLIFTQPNEDVATDLAREGKHVLVREKRYASSGYELIQDFR